MLRKTGKTITFQFGLIRKLRAYLPYSETLINLQRLGKIAVFTNAHQKLKISPKIKRHTINKKTQPISKEQNTSPETVPKETKASGVLNKDLNITAFNMLKELKGNTKRTKGNKENNA